MTERVVFKIRTIRRTEAEQMVRDFVSLTFGDSAVIGPLAFSFQSKLYMRCVTTVTHGGEYI